MEKNGVDAQRDLDHALEDVNQHGGKPDEVAGVVGKLRNSYRDELEKADFEHVDIAGDDRHGRGRILVAGGRHHGKLLDPHALRIVKPAVKPTAPDPRPLKVGDLVRALGFVYRVRKLTAKDVVMRPVRSEDLP